MVCANPPTLTNLESLKEEALNHLSSSTNQISKPIRILIVDSNNRDSWLSLPALKECRVDFVSSVHYLLCTGVYQNYFLFGISDESHEVSHKDFENLISSRMQSPSMVLTDKQLKDMTPDQFDSLLAELDSECRIQNTILHLENTRGDLNSLGSLSYNLNHRVQSNTETALKEYLRSYICGKNEKPEQILREAISLIRPQK